jgi:DNA-binding response OmpR family regulator
MAEVIRILVVDDELDTLGLIQLTLQTAGFLVEVTNTGADALHKIRNETYDVVLLDIMMPDMSGFDILRVLHSEQESFPPIIFLTAKGMEEDRELGISLGASDYLIKPATRGDLLDSIDKVMNE